MGVFRQPFKSTSIMADKLRIYTYPEEVLRKKAQAVENIDGDLQRLIDDMALTMYEAPGVGLAANQVGETRCIIVYDVSPKEEGRNLNVLINPEIVCTEGEIVQEEACLSVIDYAAEVKRCERIQVRGVDRDGEPVDLEADGLLAVCLQHEIDHLNGVLFIDHISSLKRTLYKKKLKKLLKQQ
jgi:peptide deformylase